MASESAPGDFRSSCRLCSKRATSSSTPDSVARCSGVILYLSSTSSSQQGTRSDSFVATPTTSLAHATCSGVCPSSSNSDRLAPACISRLTISSQPSAAAEWSRVLHCFHERAADGFSSSNRRASGTSLASTASMIAAATSAGPSIGASGSPASIEGRSQCTAERRERRLATMGESSSESSLPMSSPDAPPSLWLPVSCLLGMKASRSSPQPSSGKALCMGVATAVFIQLDE
mmetsp:Transcript_21942/g.66679  ORF Transcript_21942/g.66679 Transcript_21942/m.66679 type:complete len:232 (-) Transcript_21942:129-824(-)